jgi:hypothetical protein
MLQSSQREQICYSNRRGCCNLRSENKGCVATLHAGKVGKFHPEYCRRMEGVLRIPHPHSPGTGGRSGPCNHSRGSRKLPLSCLPPCSTDNRSCRLSPCPCSLGRFPGTWPHRPGQPGNRSFQRELPWLFFCLFFALPST